VNENLIAPPASCTCGCTTTKPTCATGNLTVTAGNSGSNGCQDQANQSEGAQGGCQGLSPSVVVDNSWKVNATAPSPSGGSCAASPSGSPAPVSYGSAGRTCALTGNLGAGCGGSDVCAPKAAPFTMCVAQTGDVACPAGFPAKHLTGSIVADTRSCSPCTCSLNAGACGGTLTLYGDNSCSQNAFDVVVDGTCQHVPSHSYRGYTYAPLSTAFCMSSVVTATGSAAFTDTQTVCCVN
jgi:hypothetical protein